MVNVFSKRLAYLSLLMLCVLYQYSIIDASGFFTFENAIIQLVC